jgi:AraC-like DNA-binding protein
MLAGTAAYAPTVLVAAHRPEVLQGTDPKRSPDGGSPAWRALGLRTGWASLHLDGQVRTVRAPAALLLRPGVPYGPFAFGRAATGTSLTFLLRAGAQGPRTWSQAARDRHPPEPSAAEVWDVDLPEVIPAAERDDLLIDLDRIAALWWRDAAGAYEASLILAQALARLVLPRLSRGDGGVAAACDGVAERAVRLVREALPARLGLDEVARACGLPRTTFIRRFTAAKGLSPGAAFDRARMAEACRLLLRRPAVPLPAVARACGYHDASAFGRAFRRAHGYSPQAWRRRAPETGPAED